MDRIDMWIEVSKSDHERLATKKVSREETLEAIEKVTHARKAQASRLGMPRGTLNSDIIIRDSIDALRLSKEAEIILKKGAEVHDLSARGYHRMIRLARTIADIDRSEEIKTSHMLEAFQYRKRR